MVEIAELWPDKEAHNAKEQTLLTVPEPLKQELISQGFKYAALSFWASKLSHQQAEMLPIQQHSKNLRALWFMTSFETNELGLRNHDMVFRNGHAAFLRCVRKRKVEGQYLFLGTAFREEEHRAEALEHLNCMAAHVRLAGGLGAAAEETYRVTDHLLTDQFSFDHGPLVIRHHYLDGPDPDCSWQAETRRFSQTHFSLKPETRRLFNLSVIQEDAATRFLLLWLAFEAQVGRGPRLKQFFQKEVKSKALAGRVEFLSNVRGKLAHHGKFDPKEGSELMLFLLFRISCITDHSDRTRAVEEAEKAVQQA